MTGVFNFDEQMKIEKPKNKNEEKLLRYLQANNQDKPAKKITKPKKKPNRP
jgi:hypothetical protein